MCMEEDVVVVCGAKIICTYSVEGENGEGKNREIAVEIIPTLINCAVALNT